MIKMTILATALFSINAYSAQICTTQFAEMINDKTGACVEASSGCVISDLEAVGYRIAQPGECTAQSKEAQKESLNKQVKGLISDLSCSHNSDCDAIAYGHRACGGPDTFLVYSKKNVDLGHLEYLINSYTELDRQTSSGVSICSIELKPNVKCNSQKVCSRF